MLRYLIFCCFVTLFGTCVRAQNTDATEQFRQETTLDSILKLPDDTFRLRLLYNRALSEETRGETRGQKAFLLAYNEAQKNGSNRYLALTENKLGNLYTIKGVLDSARLLLTSALTRTSDLADDRLRVDILNHLSQMEVIAQEYVKAQQYAEESAALAKRIGWPRGEALAFGSLANVQTRLKDRQKMRDYFQKGLEVARKNSLDSEIAMFAFKLADDSYRWNDLDEVEPLIAESRSAARRIGNVSLEANAINVLALYHSIKKEPAAAVRLYDTLEQINGKESVSLLANRAMAYIQLNKGSEAATDLQKAVVRAKNVKRQDIVAQVYRVAEHAYAGLGRYDSAYTYLKLRRDAMDTLAKNQSIEQAKELTVKYETAEKEAEIVRQEASLSKQRDQLLLVGGLGLLTLVGGMVVFTLYRKLRTRNAQNERLVSEKETLIGEIHHRVKNNLQVISSLLQLQSRQLADENALSALRESQGRVEAMGLIHQKLYQDDDAASVRAEVYLPELGDMLLDTYQLDDRVEMYYEIEPTQLDVDVAISLGLIINELITNSLKYAFPGDRQGTIEIRLERNDESFVVHVSDDGVGMDNSQTSGGTHFGQRLLGLLVTRLNASVEHYEQHGYATILRIPIPKMKEMPF